MNKVLYAHPRASFMVGRRRVHNRATIAWQVGDDGVTRCGVALCSPRDNFTRATGRRLALEMLETSPITIPVTGDIRTSEICGMLSLKTDDTFLARHAPVFTPFYYR